MKRIEITLNAPNYDNPTVQAYTDTSFAGLALHKAIASREWVATHIESGKQIGLGAYKTRKLAALAAAEACKLFDMEGSENTVSERAKRVKHVYKRVRNIRCKVLGELPFYDIPEYDETSDRITNLAMELMAADSLDGICSICGETQYGCEPDGRNVMCEACGTPTVRGWLTYLALA